MQTTEDKFDFANEIYNLIDHDSIDASDVEQQYTIPSTTVAPDVVIGVANLLATSIASSLISTRGHTLDVLRPLRLNPLIGGNGHASPGGWSITTPTLLCEWVVREGEPWDDVIAKVMQARRTVSVD